MEHNFKPFDKVLCWDEYDGSWRCDLFSHYDKTNQEYVTITSYIKSPACILPFEGNEHLLGTNLSDARDRQTRIDKVNDAAQHKAEQNRRWKSLSEYDRLQLSKDYGNISKEQVTNCMWSECFNDKELYAISSYLKYWYGKDNLMQSLNEPEK